MRDSACAPEIHRVLGGAPGFATASAWRAWIVLREGSAADAEADARAAYDALSGGTWSQAWCSACLGEVLIERGELRDAEAVLGAPSKAVPREDVEKRRPAPLTR